MFSFLILYVFKLVIEYQQYLVQTHNIRLYQKIIKQELKESRKNSTSIELIDYYGYKIDHN